ncbi:putative dehydrogenase [Rhizobium mongolense]|uniref:Putative dehydrogenase n=1 Tax=Rhizobium mongolense TaxID=57676 RepID=A0A7W6RWT2_9HYPH|nr:Gfo/Idh/MocA family oxidoreductase [Rhizobium mongolense]MBB4279541.1 putative dehydrogenase [Rhizobium mongolense]
MSQKIVLMGAGLIGREHAAMLRANPRVELVGIADVSEAAKAVADELGARFFTDMREMLDRMEPDGAIIALPNALHVEAALACVERNVPCMVEKPIADSLEAAMRLVTEVEKAGVPVLIGHQRRHSPDIAKARQIVRDGALGRLVAVDSLLRRGVAPPAGRRPAPHQPHPRHRLPPLHLRRYQRGHGIHVQRHTVV